MSNIVYLNKKQPVRNIRPVAVIRSKPERMARAVKGGIVRPGDHVFSHKHGRRGVLTRIDLDHTTGRAAFFYVLFSDYTRAWPVCPGDIQKIA